MSLLVKITKLITLHFISCWISSPYNPHRVWAVAGPALLGLRYQCSDHMLGLKERHRYGEEGHTKNKIIDKDQAVSVPVSHQRHHFTGHSSWTDLGIIRALLT